MIQFIKLPELSEEFISTSINTLESKGIDKASMLLVASKKDFEEWVEDIDTIAVDGTVVEKNQFLTDCLKKNTFGNINGISTSIRNISYSYLLGFPLYVDSAEELTPTESFESGTT